jgi:hypothetical protein
MMQEDGEIEGRRGEERRGEERRGEKRRGDRDVMCTTKDALKHDGRRNKLGLAFSRTVLK